MPVNGGIDRGEAFPERKGVRIRIPRRDLRQQHRRQDREAHHEHAVAGTQRAASVPDGRSLVYAAEQDNNWNVYTVSIDAKAGAVLFRLDGLKEEPVVATAGRRISARVLAGRQGDRLSRKPADVEGLQHRVEAVANRDAADKNYSYADGDQYYYVVAGLANGCWCSSARRSACSRPRSAWCRPTASGEFAI